MVRLFAFVATFLLQCSGSTTTTKAEPLDPVSRSLLIPNDTPIQLMPGMILKSKLIDTDLLQIEVSCNGDTWLSVAFADGTIVSMNGNGHGADSFVCSDLAVKRYWVLTKDTPNGGVPIQDSSCSFANGVTTMAFNRKLSTDTPLQYRISPGTPQLLLYAHGAARHLGYHGTARGGLLVDFATLQTAEAQRLPGDAAITLHLLFMTLSWGALLPWGVALANRTRRVSTEQPDAWFRLHYNIQALGCVAQLLGFAAAIWHVKMNGEKHFANAHEILGIVVIIVASLQPLNARLRKLFPLEVGRPKMNGRIIFEVVHKGFGYAAVLFGMFNVWYGLFLLCAQDYETKLIAVAALFCICSSLPVIAYFVFSFVDVENRCSTCCVNMVTSASELRGFKNTPHFDEEYCHTVIGFAQEKGTGL